MTNSKSLTWKELKSEIDALLKSKGLTQDTVVWYLYVTRPKAKGLRLEENNDGSFWVEDYSAEQEIIK